MTTPENNTSGNEAEAIDFTERDNRKALAEYLLETSTPEMARRISRLLSTLEDTGANEKANIIAAGIERTLRKFKGDRAEGITDHEERKEVLQELMQEADRIARTEPESQASVEQAQAKTSTLERRDALNTGLNMFAEEKLAPLISQLRLREREGLNPLLDEGYLNGAFGAGQRLVEELQKQTPDQSDIVDSLNALSLNLQEFGEIKITGAISEDPESLRRIGFYLQQISDDALGLSNDSATQGSPELSTALNHLRAATEKNLNFTQRKFAALNNL